MNKKTRLLSICLFALALVGCAGLNPNVGTRTADAAYQRGDCVTALKIYESSAAEGQPWAQTRLGFIYLEGKCKTKNITTAISWLKKAASYVSQTNWEKGEEFSTGPTGFFNTTTSSAIAASALSSIYANGEGVKANAITAWLWANYSVNMVAYDRDKPVFMADRLNIEKTMTTDELQRAKKLAQSWSPKDEI
jgi:TPR repeat protein